MLRKCIPLFLLSLFVCTAPLAAQLVDVSGNPAFSVHSVKLDFEDLSQGAQASRLFSAWGVTFDQGTNGVPTLIPVFVLGFSNLVVSNVPPSGDSADKPLVLNFEFPVYKVGFVARNGTETTTVTVRAFGSAGNELGSIEHTGLADPTAIAVSTSSPLGISKLSISYGSEEEPEQIDDLQFQYVSRPQFLTYLAQVANGPVPTVGVLRTSIVVANLSNSTAEGSIDFFGGEGDPLDVQIGSSLASSFPLSIPPFSSTTLVTRGEEVVVGYAKIRSNVPSQATAVFRTLSANGAVLSEAGVGGALGRAVSVGVVQKFTVGNFDSGIAIVNTADQESTAQVQLYKQDGTLFATNNSIASLAPGGHAAKFLTQMFSEVDSQPFEGTIRVVSDVPLAVVILRTSQGLVMSSLPVGSLEN
ncbi:MAG: hypothetical protein P8Z74_15510 [Acidobacteriota bacterium]